MYLLTFLSKLCCPDSILRIICNLLWLYKEENCDKYHAYRAVHTKESTLMLVNGDEDEMQVCLALSQGSQKKNTIVFFQN